MADRQTQRRRAAVAGTVIVLSVAALGIGAQNRTDREALEAIAQILVEQGIVLPTTTAGTTTTGTSPTTTRPTTTTTRPTTTTTLPATTTTLLPPTTTTTVPTTPTACNGVQVGAGANLVTVANNHPAGTTFCLAPGTYSVTAPIPIQSNDKWIGSLGPNNVRQSLISGNATTPYMVEATSDHVLFQNFIIERFNNALQQGVNRGAQTFWTWDNLEVRNNTAHAIHTHNDSRVTNSWIHHNGQMGLGGQGDRVLIENNEISWNNYQGNNASNWEGGGTKWVNANDLIVRGNFSHHNCGAGLWTDLNNNNILYENNIVEDNWGIGIFHEISGRATIRNNQIRRNAFGLAGGICTVTGGGDAGGIQVSHSRDVTVTGNLLVGNDGGVFIKESSNRGVHHAVNVLVQGNDISWNVGINGCLEEGTTSLCYQPAANIHFEDNDYHVGNDTTPFFWQRGEKTWTQWRSFGHDETGSFD